jgi:hypothetical protein
VEPPPAEQIVAPAQGAFGRAAAIDPSPFPLERWHVQDLARGPVGEEPQVRLRDVPIHPEEQSASVL